MHRVRLAASLQNGTWLSKTTVHAGQVCVCAAVYFEVLCESPGSFAAMQALVRSNPSKRLNPEAGSETYRSVDPCECERAENTAGAADDPNSVPPEPPVKRKRGRPKGSKTKNRRVPLQGATDAAPPRTCCSDLRRGAHCESGVQACTLQRPSLVAPQSGSWLQDYSAILSERCKPV